MMNAMDIANFVSEFGGPAWERPEVYAAFSPDSYVADWKKPMLVLHGSRDFRVPVEQGLSTFSALQRKGIESRFVHVPDENHWVLKPQNWVAWQQEILDWTAAHTGPAATP
jgi:acylaminoacyl-peptidase